jgi:hypothetical protein
MVKLRAEIAALRKEYVDAAREIAGVAKGELRGIFGEVGPETRRALEIALDAARRVGKGAVADWDALAKAVAGAGDMHDDLRGKLLLLIGKAQKMQASGRNMSTVLRELETAAAAAAGAVKHLGTAFDAAATADAVKEIEKIRAKIADLKDPSPAGKFDRNIRPTLGNIDPTLIDDYRRAVIDLAAAEEALRKGRAKEKRDPAAEANLSKARELTQQLAQAEQQLAQARAGVFASATKARDALEIWLATDENAVKLSAKERAARLSQADAVDAATRAYKDLADAKARADRIKTAAAGLDLEVLELDGKTVEAAKLKFKQQYEQLFADLKAEIAAGGEGAASAQVTLDVLVNVERVNAAQAQLDAMLADIQKIQDAQGRAEQSLQTEIDAGVHTELTGRERLLDIHRKTAAELARMKPLLEQLSQAPVKVGEQARVALANVEIEIEKLKSTLGELEKALQSGLQAGLQEAITGLVRGTMSLRDAVTALGNAVLDAMLKVATQHLAEKATSGLMGLLSGASAASGERGAGALGQDSGDATMSVAGTQLMTAAEMLNAAAMSLQSLTGALSGAAGSLGTAGGTLASSGGMLAGGASTLGVSGTLLTTSGTLLTTSGATLTTSGAGLTTAASGLTGAAGSLSAAATAQSAGGGGGGNYGWIGSIVSLVASLFDTGGYTGAGGKYEPAGIVHRREFVTRSEVTRQPGALAFLTDFNRHGMTVLKKWGLRHLFGLPGYADGGLVLPAPAPAIDTRALTAGWRLTESPGRNRGTTTVENRQTFNLIDDPARISDALKSRAGVESLTVVLSRDPAKFRSILGVK